MSSQSQNPTPPAEREPFRRRGRLVFTLVAVLVLVGLAPMATMAWKLIDVNREALTTSHQQFQLLLASSTAHEVDIHVDGLESQMLRVSQTLGGAIRRGNQNRDEVRRILSDVTDERMPYMRFDLFRGDKVSSTSAGELPEKLEPLFLSGLEEAAAILASSAQTRPDEAILSDPILLDVRPPRSVVVVSAPVVSGGRFRGVLSALVDLQTVLDSIMATNRRGHTIYGVDDKGRVFVSNDPVRVLPGADLSASPLVNRFVNSRRKASETMPFTGIEAGKEQEYIGSYEVTERGWGIFVQAPLDELYRPIQTMIKATMRWALFVLILAVVAAVIFARTLSLPIKRLARASRSFASGRFSTRVRVRTGNEIGELAHTFNVMAEEIEDHIRRLRRAAEENNELFLGTIRALAQAIDAKDPYTRGHSVRVNRYSVILARQLGLSEEQIRDIHVSSLLHDVGKIGINDQILQKPGQLTDAEFEVMKTHTTKGAAIMEPIGQMERIIPGLRSHHERFAGGGYPDDLAGDAIPYMARIIAVADAFDAMTTHRPYQQAMTFHQAHERLNFLKRTAFDESIVEAFNRAYLQGLIRPGDENEDEVPDPAPLASVPA